MIYRRSLLSIAAVMVAVLVMTACGNGDEPHEVVISQATSEPTTVLAGATAPAQEKSVASPQSAVAVIPAAPLPPVQALTVAESPAVKDREQAQAATLPPVATIAPAPTESPEQDEDLTFDLGPTPSASMTDGWGVAQVTLPAGDEELSTVDVVKLLSPSIVQITTEAVGMDAFNRPVPSGGVGTGVIIDTAGHILTNNHVVEGAQVITVTLSNSERHQARLVGRDPTMDTAVIMIDADGLQPAKLGVSADLQVGEDVIAIGHALGLAGGPTVSKGVVSALGRSLTTDQQNTIVDLIQTDASINPGNSGGALVNTRAEVIGINTAIISGSQGIGFALNIDDVQTVAAQLMEKGTVERGFLGITPFNLTPSVADQVGVPVEEGIVVVSVVRGSGAAAAGLRAEDVIVQLGDDDITNTGEMSRFLLEHPPGSTVDLVYYRKGTRVTTEITLGVRPG
ncbi:MAG: trypsin-like peptidase domain-containing protein [Chloroflexi bacterium]|nr:trypsin-like peptidase domain-containing protein [Chloroflexota bacterium]